MDIPLFLDPIQHIYHHYIIVISICISIGAVSGKAFVFPPKNLSQLHRRSSNLIDYSLVEDNLCFHGRSIVE